MVEIVQAAEPVDWINDSGSSTYEQAIEIVVTQKKCQTLIDGLQDLLSSGEDWRITVVPVEATLPRAEPEPEKPKEEKKEEKKRESAFREGLYQSVEKGSGFDVDFVVLTVLSAIVAAIGLNSDSVAIVIAAMVIAPLLGPILGFSLGAALGDTKLMLKAARTSLLGLRLALFLRFC